MVLIGDPVVPAMADQSAKPTDVSDAAIHDAGAEAQVGWSEKHVQEGMRAAEFFEQHARNVEAQDAENQLIAMGVGLAIGLVIVLVMKMRKK